MRSLMLIWVIAVVVVMASWMPANGAPVFVDEFPICTDSGGQSHPVIYGDTVVWIDADFGNGPNGPIHYKDLSTGQDSVVSTSLTSTWYGWTPAIDSDTVAWCDIRNGEPYDLYGYDISTQTEFIVWGDNSPSPHIDIDGDIVVGVQKNYQNLTSYDICGYDLSTQTRFLICDAPDYQYEPRTNGDVVVWQDLRAGAKEWDVYGYDLSQSTEFPVSLIGDSEASQLEPAISGDIVVWGHSLVSGQGNQSIYAYDLTTETQSLACTSASSLGTPAVSGNFVVWQDNRNGNWDIYGYDLLTQTEFPVATSVGDQMRPTIDGNIVVWEDYRNGNGDIYGAYIPEPSCLILVALGSLLLLKKYRQ